MRFEMKMPDLATTESEIRVVRWLIQPGQRVERGRPIVEVETDKATMEVESVVSGVLQEVRAKVDDAVSVGDVIAVLEVADARPSPSGPAATSGPAPAPAAAAPLPRAGAVAAAGGMFARNRAAASATAAAAPPAAAPAGIPLSTPQRVMARRMHESKQTIPHYYLQTSVDATAMAAARRAAAPGEIAWDAFFVRAAARALARFDRFCCRLDGEHLRPAGTDAIGVAVDHEGELFVIPVAAPAGKTIGQISAEIRQGVDRLRNGDSDARRIRPALMTVTNLGACNVESFTPIINPPEAAIMGVGRVRPTPVARADGSIAVEPRCVLTLSVDHRIASGKYAGDFLGAIVEEIQRPPEATS